MKKIMFLTCVVALTFIAFGCSSQTNSKGDLGETRKIDTLSITPGKVTSKPAKGKNELITINISIENKGGDVIGVGAGDFYIKDSKGKEISIDGKHENFGQEIKSKEKINGKAYFLVTDSHSKFTLLYKPNQTVEAEWENVRMP